jgi:predicted DNA-binding antitoxin AbrB/MazE fold protein
MTQITEAVYSDGVLKLVDKVELRDSQRVRLIIEPLDDSGEGNRSAALKRLLAGIESMEFSSSGRLPTREELHDRL